MADMAAFCHFWRLSPREYWQLSGHEHDTMVSYQNEFIRKEREAARRGGRR